MESKGTEEKMTYPNIYFTVDNFEDVIRIINRDWTNKLACFSSLDVLWDGCERRSDGVRGVSRKKLAFERTTSPVSWLDQIRGFEESLRNSSISTNFLIFRWIFHLFQATTSTRVAQRMSLGMYTKRRVEFVRMRGPNVSRSTFVFPWWKTVNHRS